MDGLKLVMVGAGGLTAKGKPAETPPVVLTEMLSVPEKVLIKLAGTAAVNCVGLR